MLAMNRPSSFVVNQFFDKDRRQTKGMTKLLTNCRVVGEIPSTPPQDFVVTSDTSFRAFLVNGETQEAIELMTDNNGNIQPPRLGTFIVNNCWKLREFPPSQYRCE